MVRRAFTLRLKPGALDEYVRQHDEYLAGAGGRARGQGISELTIFERDGDLFVYCEATDYEAMDRVWASEVHDRWAKVMDPLIGVNADNKVDAVPVTESGTWTPAQPRPELDDRGVRDGRSAHPDPPDPPLTESQTPMTDQQDRIAIVTGGGRGLGQAIALGLAEHGAHVVAVARSADQLAETERLAVGLPGSLVGMPCDVADHEAVADLWGASPTPRAADHPGQRGRHLRPYRARPGRRPGGMAADHPRRCRGRLLHRSHLPGRHARGRLGPHRQRQLGGRAASPGPHQQRLRHRQGGPQPVHATSRRGDRGQRRDGQRHPPGRRQDRHVGGHPRAGGRPRRRRRELRGLGRLGGETGGDPPEKAVALVLHLTSDAGGATNGQFCWIDDPLQAAVPSWDPPAEGRPWMTD